MKNPAIHSIGVPSAESSAGMVAHRERVAAEEKVASTRRHNVGDRVEAREHGGADYRSAIVLTATFGHYGWVYRVKFRDGHERKVRPQEGEGQWVTTRNTPSPTWARGANRWTMTWTATAMKATANASCPSPVETPLAPRVRPRSNAG